MPVICSLLIAGLLTAPGTLATQSAGEVYGEQARVVAMTNNSDMFMDQSPDMFMDRKLLARTSV